MGVSVTDKIAAHIMGLEKPSGSVVRQANQVVVASVPRRTGLLDQITIREFCHVDKPENWGLHIPGGIEPPCMFAA